MAQMMISAEDIKADYMKQKQINQRLAAENARLVARNDQLQAWKNRQNARRLELIEGKRETRKHAVKRVWWCGIAMGLWLAVWIKIALWALGV